MKILIVSPLGTHPSHEGNRKRIVSLAAQLQRLGHVVHLAVLPNHKFDLGDVAAMKAFWGQRLHMLAPSSQWTMPFRVRRQIASRLLRWATPQFGTGGASLTPISDVDDFYHDWWSLELAVLQARHRFKAVICEYVFTSRALLAFGADITKVIDTHDIFSGRNEAIHQVTGMAKTWLSTEPQSEGAGLDRATVVLGIQEGESVQLRQLCQSPVVTVGHVMTDESATARHAPFETNSLLFVGSTNTLNADGCRWFIHEVLPAVRLRVPNAKLRVVGGVAARIADSAAGAAGVELVGPVEDLSAEYQRAAVVINPVQFGTGLAIKAVEALAYGKALICTEVGARGIATLADGRPACVVVRGAQAFGDAVVEMLTNEGLRERQEAAARAFVAEWNTRQTENLRAAIEMQPSDGKASLLAPLK